MSLTFNNEYFEKNANKLFSLRKALSERRLQDDQLENKILVRRFIRDAVGIRSKITSPSCDSLKDYLRSYGGINAYLQEPAFLASVYIAMAVYNLRIQDEIDDLLTYSDLSSYEAQLLVSDLLGEEEIADEASAERYRELCCTTNYKRAEDAVEKNVDNVSSDHVELIKLYLRNYIKTGSPLTSKYNAFQLSLLKRNSTPPRQVKRSPRKRRSPTEALMRTPNPIEAHCVVDVQSPFQEVYVKVERLSQDYTSPQALEQQDKQEEQQQQEQEQVEEQRKEEEEEEEQQGNDIEMVEGVDEIMLVDKPSPAKSPMTKDVGVQTEMVVEEKEGEADSEEDQEEYEGPRPRDDPSTSLDTDGNNNKSPAKSKLNQLLTTKQGTRCMKNKMRINLVHINRQRYVLYVKQLQLEHRESAISARELAVEMREAAVACREKLAVKADCKMPPTVDSTVGA